MTLTPATVELAKQALFALRARYQETIRECEAAIDPCAVERWEARLYQIDLALADIAQEERGITIVNERARVNMLVRGLR